MLVRVLTIGALVFALTLAGCSGGETETAETESAMEGEAVVTQAVVAEYAAKKFVEPTETTTYPLYETGDLDVENAMLVYTAQVKTENLDGDAMLEMWCVFEGTGEFFSRGMDSTITGTTDWTELTTAFRLEEGQNPDNVKLNIIAGGAGQIWVQDVKLTRMPLPQEMGEVE